MQLSFNKETTLDGCEITLVLKLNQVESMLPETCFPKVEDFANNSSGEIAIIKRILCLVKKTVKQKQ